MNAVLLSVVAKIEQWINIDLRYFLKGSFWLMLSNIVSSTLLFFLAIVLANALPPDTYGTYRFVISALALLSISTLSGVGPIFAQAVARGKDGSFYAILRTRMVWGLVGSVGALMCAIFFYIKGNNELTLVFLIISLFVPFLDSLTLYQDYLLGKKEYKKVSLYYNTTQIVLTLSIAFAALMVENVLYLIVVHLSAWLMLRIYFFFYALRKFPLNNESDPNTVSLGKHASLTEIITVVAGSIDQVLIFIFLGPIQVAVYSFAITPVMQLVHLFRNIQTVAIPKLTVKTVNEISDTFKHRLMLGIILGIIIFFFYFLLSGFIFRIFFPSYNDSIAVTKLLAVMLLFALPQTVVTSFVSSKIHHLRKQYIHFLNIPGVASILFVVTTIGSMGLLSVIYGRLLYSALYLFISISLWKYISNKGD